MPRVPDSDGRSTRAKLTRAIRADLRADLDHEPSTAEGILLDQAADAIYRTRHTDLGHDDAVRVSNLVSRLLRQLGLAADPAAGERPPSRRDRREPRDDAYQHHDDGDDLPLGVIAPRSTLDRRLRDHVGAPMPRVGDVMYLDKERGPYFILEDDGGLREVGPDDLHDADAEAHPLATMIDLARLLTSRNPRPPSRRRVRLAPEGKADA